MDEPVALLGAERLQRADRRAVPGRPVPARMVARLHEPARRVERAVVLEHDDPRPVGGDRLPDPVVAAVDVDREHVGLLGHAVRGEQRLDVVRRDHRVRRADAGAPVLALQQRVARRATLDVEPVPAEDVGEHGAVVLDAGLRAELDEERPGRPERRMISARTPSSPFWEKTFSSYGVRSRIEPPRGDVAAPAARELRQRQQLLARSGRVGGGARGLLQDAADAGADFGAVHRLSVGVTSARPRYTVCL